MRTKLSNIISEITFYTYEGMIRVSYQNESALVITDLIRALPGVTRVTNAGNSEESQQTTLRVKLISQKGPKEAFESLKKAAVERYSVVKRVEVAANTIETK